MKRDDNAIVNANLLLHFSQIRWKHLKNSKRGYGANMYIYTVRTFSKHAMAAVNLIFVSFIVCCHCLRAEKNA